MLSFSLLQPLFLPPNPLSQSIFLSPHLSLISLPFSLLLPLFLCISLSSIPKSSQDLSLLFSFLSKLLSLFSTFFCRSLYSLPSSVNSQSLFSTSISRSATLSSGLVIPERASGRHRFLDGEVRGNGAMGESASGRYLLR